MESSNANRSEYDEVEYLQFRASGLVQKVQRVVGVLFWPLVWPLAKISRVSDLVFRTFSELFSMIPYFPGVIVRREFYRFALDSFGENVLVEFGVIFIHSSVSIGNNVLLGRYSIIHHCDIGDDVLVGERCTFLSGKRQHRFARIDIPMTAQGGQKKRIRIANDCWIGSHSVIMESIPHGCIVGSGSNVMDSVPELSILAGSPAKVITVRN